MSEELIPKGYASNPRTATSPQDTDFLGIQQGTERLDMKKISYEDLKKPIVGENWDGTTLKEVDDHANTLQDQVDALSIGGPKGVYDTLVDLQTADPDHTFTYVVNADGNWYFWNTTSSDWASGGVYNDSTAFNDLAGTGRTTETVKQNADNIDAIKGVGYTEGSLKTHEDRLDTLEGADTVVGSVAKTVKDAVEPIISYVNTPQNFTWKNSILEGKIWKIGKYDFSADITPEELLPEGNKITYYVSKTGSDSNDGLSLSTAFSTIRKAVLMATADVVEVFVDDGIYYRSLDDSNPTKNIILKAINSGKVIITTAQGGLVWSAVDGFADVYSTTRSATYMVRDTLDIDEDGHPRELILKTSVEEVSITPGSYFISGGTVYVKTFDNRQPSDDDVWCFVLASNFNVTNSITLYVDGIAFHGGTFSSLYINHAGLEDTMLLICKDCEFAYSNQNGVGLLGGNSILFGCKAYKNRYDGFNYHKNNTSGIINKCVEINCIAYKNGIGGSNNNGSTIHDGGKIIRVGCRYWNNGGPNIADISDGTEVWCLGVSAFDSLGASSKYDFFLGSGVDVTKGFYQGCVSLGASSFNFVSLVGSLIYEKDCIFATQNMSGTKIYY